MPQWGASENYSSPNSPDSRGISGREGGTSDNFSGVSNNNSKNTKPASTGNSITSALLGGLGGLALGGLPGAIAGGFKGYNEPFTDFNFNSINLGALGGEYNGARSANTGPTGIGVLGPQSSDNTFGGSGSGVGGSSNRNNNSAPRYNYDIDTGGFFSQDSANSIADAILNNQYTQTLSGFDTQLARGLITPESYKLSKGNLDTQKGTLGDLYRSTALGELTKGTQSLNEMLTGFKNNPSSLTIGEGQTHSDALTAALQARADQFNQGFESSVTGAIGPENQFQKAQAVQAGIPGQAVQSTSPLVAAIANRQNDEDSRRLGDRTI